MFHLNPPPLPEETFSDKLVDEKCCNLEENIPLEYKLHRKTGWKPRSLYLGSKKANFHACGIIVNCRIFNYYLLGQKLFNLI